MNDADLEALMRATGTEGFPSDVRRLVEAVQAAERERCARAPLTEGQIDDMLGEANRGFCIERDDYIKAVRDAEQAHGIGA